MSVFSPKRVLFSVVAATLLTSNAFAVNPSPRTYARMVFDQQAGEIILFGGVSPFDRGTQMAYDGNETWAWNGSRWVQRFPAHRPPGRTGHMMTYDSTRGRIVLFGGRQMTGTTTGEVRALSDMWVYDNNDWTEITPAEVPTPRHLAAMAYDPVRDRIILHGGLSVAEDGVTFGPLNDTWEFDGTTWTRLDVDVIKVARPVMVYDKARSQMVLIAVDAELKTKMYRRDPAANTWVEMTPEKLPDCANDSNMVYQDHNDTIMLVGGFCSVAAGFNEKTWEWDGTTWNEITAVTHISRGTGAALAYDSLRHYALMYGGANAINSLPRSDTYIYSNRDWRFASLMTRPSPRSLFALSGDPVTKTVWLVGGLNETTTNYEGDVWGYRGGQWFTPVIKDVPSTCDAPLAAFDIDRGKLVVACWPSTSPDIEVFEFDGPTASFRQVTTSNDKPEGRRQGALVYDEALKKIVLFGGFDGQDFRDDTWTWDGTRWTEVRRDRPTNRSLHAMWYDPLQRKTILYGGIGRESIDERVERFSDMWAFNGNGWTKLNVTTTPGERLGAQYAVDQATGKLILFGGLKSELTDPDRPTSRTQFFDNQTWQWDGSASTWTRLSPTTVPDARQNGRMVWDPSTNRVMLFGGYAGFYFSDVWYWTGTNWQVMADNNGGRRRASGSVPPPTND